MTAPRRHRRWRHALAALASLLSVAVVVTVGAMYSYASYRVDQISKAPALPHLQKRQHYDDPFTMLVVGTDDRTGTHNAYGHESIACKCSDTMILARVDPKDQRVSLLSIPRDSYVHLTGLDEKGKLNAAFTRGPDNLIQTIEQAFGIPVNHYVLVDLASFKRTVDALGGIDMDVPMPVRDKNAHLDIARTGCHRLTGDQALAISRARELQYYADGDWTYDPTWEYGRNRREQIFLKVLARQVLSRGMSNPLTANRVIATFTDHGIQTDSAVGTRELVSLAGQFSGFDADGIDSYTLPTYTQEHTPDWGDVEILQPHEDLATIAAWYGTSVPAAGITLPAAGITTPFHPHLAAARSPSGRPAAAAPDMTAATGSPTASASTGAGGSSSGSGSSAGGDAKATVNQPRPWDPRGCRQ